MRESLTNIPINDMILPGRERSVILCQNGAVDGLRTLNRAFSVYPKTALLLEEEMKKGKTIKCLVCGKSFINLSGRHKYCSRKCLMKASNDNSKEYRDGYYIKNKERISIRDKNYRGKGFYKEEKKEYDRLYCLKNKEKKRIFNRIWRKTHKRKANTSSRKYDQTSKGRYSRCKRRAQLANIKFNLSYDEFLFFLWRKPCYYCERLLDKMGVDRLDSSKGYDVSNCVSSCRDCNLAKAEMGVDEFKEWIILVYNRFIIKKKKRGNNEYKN